MSDKNMDYRSRNTAGRSSNAARQHPSLLFQGKGTYFREQSYE